MSRQRQFLAWLIAALAATALLGFILFQQYREARATWSTFLVGDPHEGLHLFQEKGCAQCHSVNGLGSRLGPDLGFELSPQSGPSQLVVAMWNHAPRMWERMEADRKPYPTLSRKEMANLFAYLYTQRYVEEPGDLGRGRDLFASKGCIQCHAVRGEGGQRGPDLAAITGVDTPIVWAQTMWNHAPTMETEMTRAGLTWPRFTKGEMGDLLAFVRNVSSSPRRESGLLPANVGRGRKIFEDKSCSACHAVEGHGGAVGPQLGPGKQADVTPGEFAALMWNHAPPMWRAMQERGIARPTFEGQEMADLMAFLFSIRCFDPVGSVPKGASLFAQRRCASCHGPQAEGSAQAPALRGRGIVFTPITFATALWKHGPKMYQRSVELREEWPILEEKDLNDLLTFLNSPPEGKP